VAIAARLQPSRPPLDLYWRGADAAPAAAQFIRLYDLQGRRVRELPLGSAGAGVAQWDGRDEDGRPVPAGIYFARLTSGSVHAQARVVLLP
jgi:flagellar hook assembly protein FlgD